MNIAKISKVLMFILVGIILTVLFWQNPILLCLLLTASAFAKHKLLPIKKELLWFIISGLLGSIVESIIMLSGPWKYAQTHLFNFPIWLVFLWGFAGILGISFYQAITKTDV